MTAVVVVGIGSPFGADRLGWEVVEQLQRSDELQPYVPERVSLHTADRPGAGLLDYFPGARLAILVDAVQAELATGTLLRLQGDEIGMAPLRLSSHGFGVVDALALGRILNELPPQVVLLGIEAGPDVQLMPYRKHVDRLTQATVAEVRRYYEPEACAALVDESAVSSERFTYCPRA